MLTKKYYFQIVVMDGEDNIAVCEQNFWNQNKCIDDAFDKEMHDFMDDHGCYDAMESIYEIPDEKTKKEVIKLLIAAGSEEKDMEISFDDDEDDDWMDEEDEDED